MGCGAWAIISKRFGGLTVRPDLVMVLPVGGEGETRLLSSGAVLPVGGEEERLLLRLGSRLGGDEEVEQDGGVADAGVVGEDGAGEGVEGAVRAGLDDDEA